jgi:hypothetical protein
MILYLFCIMLFCSSSSPIAQPKTIATTDPVYGEQLPITPIEDMPQATLDDITVEDDFATQLNAITMDYLKQYRSIKGIQIESDTIGTTKRFNSLVPLEGALTSFIEVDTVTGEVFFQAQFPGSTVRDFGLRAYDRLIANVEYTKLSCCILMKSEETIIGNIHSQKYRGILVVDSSTPEDPNIIIEVMLIARSTTGDAGTKSAIWTPVVKVYGQH